ncbi:hypothetical protein NDU88_005269 [Pleurodeles waltl]|uniref:Uncharacterized protein n=1 Tax=Pleurodeles waltl TaxID=8319 RepID=A0AAV7PF14_PLEWA|nr:hypothetical protein NDU88_005269 [Pleurodeles waltl]
MSAPWPGISRRTQAHTHKAPSPSNSIVPPVTHQQPLQPLARSRLMCDPAGQASLSSYQQSAGPLLSVRPRQRLTSRSPTWPPHASSHSRPLCSVPTRTGGLSRRPSRPRSPAPLISPPAPHCWSQVWLIASTAAVRSHLRYARKCVPAQPRSAQSAPARLRFAPPVLSARQLPRTPFKVPDGCKLFSNLSCSGCH